MLLLPQLATHNIVSGKTILLTGAGGSIGSALAKAIIRMAPRRLILLDHSERNLNQIDLELAAATNDNSYTSVLGDICDARLLSELFRRYRPEVAYHAAAFKHVPLMESNPIAVVRNNALGTALLAQVAREEGATILVMVSTDKAVNPISIMGASKRIAEQVLLRWNNSKTRYECDSSGKCARFPGKRRAEVLAANFAWRAGHGHPRRRIAIFFNYRRGRRADTPGIRASGRWRNFRTSTNSASENSGRGPAIDSRCQIQIPERYPRSLYRPSSRGQALGGISFPQ